MSDNVVDFPNRGTGMPQDRSGNMSAKEQYKLEREAKAKAKKQKETAQLLNSPVTVQQFNESMMRMYAGLEKVAQEVRVTQIRLETAIRVMTNKGVMSKELFKQEVQEQVGWNSLIDALTRRDETIPIHQVVKQVSEWNNEHELKISWQHIDLGARLIKEESITLEEKLMIAAEMEMPEAFIQALRDKEYNASSEEKMLDTVQEGFVTPEEETTE